MNKNQFDHIAIIKADFQATERLKNSFRNAVKTLAEDLYSKDTHFIFELIQNAEDNDYKECEPMLSFKLVKKCPVSKHFTSGALIIQNNETGFTYKNVDAICAVGRTTKSKIQGYIGEKGIGFKSVFRITTTPYIISNGYRFSMPEYDEETGLGYIVPQWLDEETDSIDQQNTIIILPINKEDYSYEKIEKMLHEIEPETILFLSKIKEIQITTESGDNLTILKDDTKAPIVQLLIEGIKQGITFSQINEYLLYTRPFVKPDNITHEKRIGVDIRDVSIAIPLNLNNDKDGKIFAYLPVKSGMGLPFIINSDFILTSSREEIQSNVPWNKWLMNCVAIMLEEVLPDMKEKGLLNVTFLEKIASSLNKFSADSLYYPIVQAVVRILSNQALLPTDTESFVSASNAKLARGKNLRILLNQNQLNSLFQSKSEIKMLSGDITQDRTPALRDFLIYKLNVEEMNPEGFARKVTETFLQLQSDEWLISFYQYIATQKNLWKPGKGYWNPPGVLRSKPFIRLQDGSHVKPFNDDGSPNAYLLVGSETETMFPIVKTDISKHEEVQQFLRRLGIPDLDIVAEVIEGVLPKYSSSVSITEHLGDLVKITRAYATDSQEKKRRLRDKLRGTAIILAENPMLGTISYQKPTEVYFRNELLLAYFSRNDQVGFVDTNYDHSFLILFKDIGVTDVVRVNREKVDHQGNVIITDIRGWHKRGLNGFDPDIDVDGLDLAIANPTLEISAFIWNNIAVTHSACIRGVVQTSTRQAYDNAENISRVSDFGRLLIETAWLPKSNGVFVKPDELSLEDLPESFKRDEKLADQLYMKKNVFAQLAEKVGVQTEDIELLKQHPDEFQEWKLSMIAKKQKPVFPQKNVVNPERRQEMLSDNYTEQPEKEYEIRERSVRTTKGNIDPTTWLRNQYTNESGQMICQICKEEMPFRKRNGEYYFEAVEAFPEDLTKEYEAQYLALCPVCAAMYKEFVKYDNKAIEAIKNVLASLQEPEEVSLTLGDRKTSIRFVGSHFLDMKTIIGLMIKHNK